MEVAERLKMYLSSSGGEGRELKSQCKIGAGENAIILVPVSRRVLRLVLLGQPARN